MADVEQSKKPPVETDAKGDKAEGRDQSAGQNSTRPGQLDKGDLGVVQQISQPADGKNLVGSVLPDTKLAASGTAGDAPRISDAARPAESNVVIMGDPNSRQYNSLAEAMARWMVPNTRIPVESQRPVPNNVANQYNDMTAAFSQGGTEASVRLPSGEILRNPTTDQLAEKLGLHVHPKDKAYDVVVVGAGPGGLSAGINGAAEGYKTLVVGGDAIGGQAGLSSLIENLPGHTEGISGPELTRRSFEQAQRLGAEVLVHNWANEMRQDADGNHVIKLSDGNEVKARAVILATGLSARELKARDGSAIPGVEEYSGKSVFYGAGPEQTDAVQGKRITIIGGANSAGQAAVNLAENGAGSVDIAIRGKSLDEGMSAYLIEKINEINKNAREKTGHDVINVHTGTGIDEKVGLSGDGNRLQAVNVIKNGEKAQIPADKMLVFIGSEPKSNLGEVARDARGSAITGSQLGDKWDQSTRKPLPHETSVPGVFAIGDGSATPSQRVAIAQGEGSAAIRNVIGYFGIKDAQAKSTAVAAVGRPETPATPEPPKREARAEAPHAASGTAGLARELREERPAQPHERKAPGELKEASVASTTGSDGRIYTLRGDLERANKGDVAALDRLTSHVKTVGGAPDQVEALLRTYRDMDPKARDTSFGPIEFLNSERVSRARSPYVVGGAMGGAVLLGAMGSQLAEHYMRSNRDKSAASRPTFASGAAKRELKED